MGLKDACNKNALVNRNSLPVPLMFYRLEMGGVFSPALRDSCGELNCLYPSPTGW